MSVFQFCQIVHVITINTFFEVFPLVEVIGLRSGDQERGKRGRVGLKFGHAA